MTRFLVLRLRGVFVIAGAAAKYPARFAGAHGKGLKKLNLVLADEKDDD